MHSLPACDVFHNPESNCYFFISHAWIVRRLCVTGTNLGQRKHNEFRECALLVPNVRLASTFTLGNTLTFLKMQKMCAEVDAYNK